MTSPPQTPHPCYRYAVLCLLAVLLLCPSATAKSKLSETATKPDQTIFAFGGDINKKFVQYVVDLTHKPDPKICFVPTASADNPDNIKFWEFICKQLSIESHVLKVWVSSDKNAPSFEEILLSMDAIVVGGGNTLNMMGIWKNQGIDTLLRKALDRGIILAGGSAGSICWFQNGISDSRPTALSTVDGLSFLPYSNCPHYVDSTRKTIYHQQIENREIASGYAMDDLSGILFRNGKFIEAVSLNEVNHSYHVYSKNGKIYSEKLPSRILINNGALPVSEYSAVNVDKRVRDFPEINRQNTPLNAYVSILYILANGQDSKLSLVSIKSLRERMGKGTDSEVSEEKRNMLLNKNINKILIYNDSLAGVINEYSDFYGLWFLYKEEDQWLSAGEDFGGYTVLQSEITFREKAAMHLERMRKNERN